MIALTSVILSFLTIAVVSVILYKNYMDSVTSYELTGALQNIYQNLNAILFSNATVVQGSCPAGYVSISNLGNWEGTDSFCYDNGYVDESTPRITCKNYYNAQGPYDYLLWKNFTICVLQVTDWSNSSTCSASETSCYTGVCVAGSQCPITDLQFSTQANNANGWTSVQYNNTFYINYRHDPGNLPLATFRINIGNPTPCLSSLEYSLQQNYSANAINGTGCADYGVFPSSKTVDTDNALATFYSQGWSSGVINLPGYAEILNSQTAYLTASSRIELAPTCSSMRFDCLRVGAADLNSIQQLTERLGIAALIVICLPLIVTTLVLMALCNSSFDASGYNCDTNVCKACVFFIKCSFFLPYPCTTIILIPAIICTGSAYSKFAPFSSDYQLITQNNCFVDEAVKAVLQQLIDAIGTEKTIYHLWIALSVPYWIIFVFWLYFGIRYLKLME